MVSSQLKKTSFETFAIHHTIVMKHNYKILHLNDEIEPITLTLVWILYPISYLLWPVNSFVEMMSLCFHF